MGEYLTSCMRVELRGCSLYGRDVSTYDQCMTCLQTDGNYRIKLPGLGFDDFHGRTVRNFSSSPGR